MRRIVETDDGGMDALLGKRVLFMCANYFYVGRLIGLNEISVQLDDASLVYETGRWDSSSWKDAERLPSTLNIMIHFIESYFEVDK